MNAPPPITRAQLPEDWVEVRRVIIHRDGYAIRPGGGNTIEIKSITPREQMAAEDPLRLNVWIPISLAGGAVAFTSTEDRDAVLGELQKPFSP